MYDSGNRKLVFCDNLEGWGGEGVEREFRSEWPMANSRCCMAKPITIL